MPTPLTDADKVLRNDTGIDIATNIASIASALTPSNITDLGDVNLTNPITDGQVIKYDTATQKWINGLGNITMECNQAQYDAWKQSGQLKPNTLYVITDAPNLNATAQDISYDGGADTVWDKVESLKTSKANESGVAISKSTNFIGVDYSVTAYNITTSSTLSSAVQIRYKYDGNLLTISGRIVLDISSRTGSNGGVTIALKSGKKIKNSLDNYVGVSTYKTEPRNGEATILYADANATSFRLSASESYANLQSGKTLVLYVSPLSIELADT